MTRQSRDSADDASERSDWVCVGVGSFPNRSPGALDPVLLVSEAHCDFVGEMEVVAFVGQNDPAPTKSDVAFCNCLGPARAFDLEIFAGPAGQEERAHGQVRSMSVGFCEGQCLHHFQDAEANSAFSFRSGILALEAGALP
jgi:hypothetical protein